MSKYDSKAPKMVTCKGCGKYRQHHAHGYCRSCYMREGFSKRRIGICANFAECPHGTAPVEIMGRGLCAACYERARYANELERWPLVSD